MKQILNKCTLLNDGETFEAIQPHSDRVFESTKSSSGERSHDWQSFYAKAPLQKRNTIYRVVNQLTILERVQILLVSMGCMKINMMWSELLVMLYTCTTTTFNLTTTNRIYSDLVGYSTI